MAITEILLLHFYYKSPIAIVKHVTFITYTIYFEILKYVC